MKKIFLDQEFLEGFRRPLLGRRRHFIDLISIGLVDEANNTYYAVCNEFDVAEAYYRADKQKDGTKVYWLRDNVLQSIFRDLAIMEAGGATTVPRWGTRECLRELRRLLGKYGKTRKEIREEVYDFVNPHYQQHVTIEPVMKDPDGAATSYVTIVSPDYKPNQVQFIGYFADYDWVLFCSLWGKMIELPKGFPMYCYDLKQQIDDAATRLLDSNRPIAKKHYDFDQTLQEIKSYPQYPKQENEHNALADAQWNSKLHAFLNNL